MDPSSSSKCCGLGRRPEDPSTSTGSVASRSQLRLAAAGSCLPGLRQMHQHTPCPVPLLPVCPVSTHPCLSPSGAGAGDSQARPLKGPPPDAARSSDRDADLWGELEDAAAPPRWRHVRRRTAVRSAPPVPDSTRDAPAAISPCAYSPPPPHLPNRQAWISRCVSAWVIRCCDCLW